MNRLSRFLLCGLVAGCAAPVQITPAPVRPTPPPAATPAPEPIPAAPAPPALLPGEAVRVSMIVEAWSRGEIHVIEPGETLYSGDRLALRVELDQPAYVYAVHADARGQITRLFPLQGQVRLGPGRPHRVPPVGQWLKLDRETGTEELFVVAQTEPMTPEQLTRRVGEELRLAPPPPRKRRRPRARTQVGALTIATRGLEQQGAVRGLAIEQGTDARLDPGRAALIRFSFQHK